MEICNIGLACEEAEISAFVPLGHAGNSKEVRYAELHINISCGAFKNYLPGQFVMIRPLFCNNQPVPYAWGHDLIWARAFSICRVEEDPSGLRVVLFLQLVGRGTPALLSLRPGDRVLIWGPLGNGFAVNEHVPTLMLAGGLGVAPFVGYALKHAAPENLSLEFGHRVELSAYPLANFPANVRLNAHHEKGPEDLSHFLSHIKEQIFDHAKRGGMVLACGPKPLLKAIHGFAKESGARCQLSMENQMACGSGACLGCTVKAGPAFAEKPMPHWPIQVCLYGPAFWTDEISFE